MSDSNLEDLLKKMPEIAEAVNGFASEEIQQQAFAALMRSAGVTPPSGARSEEPEEHAAPEEEASSGRPGRKTKAAKPSKAAPRPKKTAVQAPKIVADLNLRPSGKKSFRDFVAEKDPKNANDKNVVAVYYLKNELGVAAVGVDHVFTCYRDMQGSWKLPNNIRNALQVTSSTVGFIGTTNMDDVQLHAAGTNRVEHDLPVSVKKK